MPALAVLQVVVVAGGAWGLGRTLIGPRIGRLHPALRFALQAALGLLVVAMVVYAQSLVGVGRGRLLGVTLAVGVIGAVEIGRWWRAPGRSPIDLRAPHFVGLTLAAIWCLWVVAAAALPPTATGELVRDLEVPRRILQAGRFPAFTDNVDAYRPALATMLGLLGMGVAGETAARLFHALAGLLGSLAVYGAARACCGRWTSLLAAAAYATVPTVLVVASQAGSDLTFALFTFLALQCTLQAVRAWDRGRDEEILPWAVLGGLMAGGACASRYAGLAVVAMILAVAGVEVLRSARRGLPRALIAVPALGLLTVLPMLARNLWMTGWPFIPYRVDGLALVSWLNWDAERAGALLSWASSRGGEASLVGRFVATVQAFVTARFDEAGAFDGMIGPLFLLAPVALLHRDAAVARRLQGPAIFAALFLVSWAWAGAEVRDLLPALPVLAVMTAAAVEGRGRRWLAPVCVALVLANGALGIREVLRGDPQDYWLGRQSRGQYQAARVPGFALYRWADDNLAAGERLQLVNLPPLGYLLDLPESASARARAMLSGRREPFPGGFRADHAFPQYSVAVAMAGGAGHDDPAELFAARGITHVMFDERLTSSPFALGPRQRDLLLDWLRRHGELVVRDPHDPGKALWRLHGNGGPR